VTLRPAGADDGPFVARLVREEFGVGEGPEADGEPPPPEDHRWTRIVEVHGEPVGCLRAEHAREGGFIAGFVVECGRRGQGIGRAGLRSAVAELLEGGAWPISLEVETENDHALGLYRDTGFEVVSTMDYFELPRP
jgi:ribosomal protein S18 acetylase RimI-like enzyme